MKKTVVVLLAGICVCLSACSHKAGTQNNSAKCIIWNTDLVKILAQAKLERKPVMADFVSEESEWCKKMDAEVFCDPGVVKLSQKFLNVKIDVYKTPEAVTPYGIGSLPTILFLDRDGELLQPVVGYSETKDFKKVMSVVLRKSGTL